VFISAAYVAHLWHSYNSLICCQLQPELQKRPCLWGRRNYNRHGGGAGQATAAVAALTVRKVSPARFHALLSRFAPKKMPAIDLWQRSARH
jgi:hypothetical protein